MLTIPDSQSSQDLLGYQSDSQSSQDLLGHRSEQAILAIFSFLDLKSLENLQLTNRRMRKLFVTSLWKNLTIVTFDIKIIPLDISPHEIFRMIYFDRHPQELIQFQDLMRQKRLGERRKLGTRERETPEERRMTIAICVAFHFMLEIVEAIMLLVILVILAICTLLSLNSFTYTDNCVPDYTTTAFTCQNSARTYLTMEYVTIGFAFGSFASFLLFVKCCEEIGSQKKIAWQSILTLLKFLVILRVIIYYILAHQTLENSLCNGFSVKTDRGLCTIEPTFGVTGFLIVAIAFMPLELVNLLNFSLEFIAIYDYLRPVKRQPLLQEYYDV